MKKRSIRSFFAVTLVVASLMTGCGGSGETTQEQTTGQNKDTEVAAGGEIGETADGVAETSKGEVVPLTALIVKHSLTKDVNEMQWLANLEERCGVDVEWQQISADWDQKKNAIFASGDIPDVMLSAATDSDFEQFNGLFEDMAPLIEQYAPNIQALFEAHPELEYLCKTEDGKIYTLPRIDEYSLNIKCVGSMFINKTWLDNLGMEVPSTWDELEEVLIAFKEQDANGNGDPNDEIPMDFSNVVGDFSPVHLLGGLGLPLSGGYREGYFVEDGQVKCLYVDERFKSLLEFLQSLYGQGLINPETFTQDYSAFQSLGRGEGGDAKVGFTFGWSPNDRFGGEVDDQYLIMEPIKADASLPDEQLYWTNIPSAYAKNQICMSASCENKEAAMRFIDGFYDEVVSLEVSFGGCNEVDNCIQDNGDGSYTILPPADSSIDDSTWKWTNGFLNNGGFWVRASVPLERRESELVTEGEKAVYLPYENTPEEDYYPDDLMKYNKDDQNVLAMNQTNMSNIWTQQVAQWIVGTDSIEAGWDAYIDSIENAGLSQTLEVRQKAYDTYMASQAE